MQIYHQSNADWGAPYPSTDEHGYGNTYTHFHLFFGACSISRNLTLTICVSRYTVQLESGVCGIVDPCSTQQVSVYNCDSVLLYANNTQILTLSTFRCTLTSPVGFRALVIQVGKRTNCKIRSTEPMCDF